MAKFRCGRIHAATTAIAEEAARRFAASADARRRTLSPRCRYRSGTSPSNDRNARVERWIGARRSFRIAREDSQRHAFPDKAFSGIGGSHLAHALNYCCFAVAPCGSARRHALSRNRATVTTNLLEGMESFIDKRATPRSRLRAFGRTSSCTRDQTPPREEYHGGHDVDGYAVNDGLSAFLPQHDFVNYPKTFLESAGSRSRPTSLASRTCPRITSRRSVRPDRRSPPQARSGLMQPADVSQALVRSCSQRDVLIR